ncbi:PREDICTED: uncharacterized protein LOC105817531 [Propithecus coquereli]|uniref:uncharacterized protein LOC105817531 n=1 Tax=Propithecus coquereli TaxID=379532 RepID=UPI00063F0887|nr:PREDICTED: uncharacterized protein LOC105817531 [Propithecus coquereli]
MPILKSLGVADPKVPRAGTLPQRSSQNPFEEVSGLEEEEAGELGTLPNGTSCRRRTTLEKLAGLAPFQLGWAPGRRAGSPGDGQPRSFLGRVLPPGLRRSSADFGLLARLQGTRAQGDEETAGEAARRLAFLRLGRGPKPRRASLAERVVPAGEAAPEPPPKVPEPPKMKEPLSGESEALPDLDLGESRRLFPSPLEALRARLLEDMAVVRGRLAPAYPAGLGAFGVYLRGYHGALAEWLGTSARRRLPLADRYALLHWHNQVYPRISVLPTLAAGHLSTVDASSPRASALFWSKNFSTVNT